MAATRWSNETELIHAHGAYVNLIENTFSRHEDAIVDLIEKYNVTRSFFTGHSLGGGLANVAHLVVRGQLKKVGSPWAKLDGKVNWLCLSFAAPATIVRLYEPGAAPPLIRALDSSSFNIVYGCDLVPREGMLAYVGNVLELVVPNVVEDGIIEKIPILGFFLKYLALLKWLSPEGSLEKEAESVVKYLKKTGNACILNSLTNLGTVVYQKSEHDEYMYLTPEAKIREVLDVKNEKEFAQLLGWEKYPQGNPRKIHFLQNLLSAHMHVLKFTRTIKDPTANAK